MADVRVVFVVGKGRSGSTLLDDMLGTLRGVESLGEVRQVWDRGAMADYTCSCGLHVVDCPVWGEVTAAAVGTTPAAFAAVAAEQASVHSWWRAPLMLARPRTRRVRRFGEILGHVYRHLARVTGADTLVDSSKWPLHVGLLGDVPGIEPWGLHLVRDPRAVAHSYTRTKRRVPGQPEMPRFGAVHSSLSWTARNVASEIGLGRLPPARVRRVRYEDLVDQPRASLVDLGRWLGAPDPDAAFVDDRTLHLDDAHLIGGNPRRFDRGDVTIAADEAWRSVGAPGATATVARLTRPLRRRYGYHDTSRPL